MGTPQVVGQVSELALVDGQFFTVDEEQPWVSAVLFRDGVIAAVVSRTCAYRVTGRGAEGARVLDQGWNGGRAWTVRQPMDVRRVVPAFRSGNGSRTGPLDLEQFHGQARVHSGDRHVAHDVGREPALVVLDVGDAYADEVVGYAEHAP